MASKGTVNKANARQSARTAAKNAKRGATTEKKVNRTKLSPTLRAKREEKRARDAWERRRAQEVAEFNRRRQTTAAMAAVARASA